MPKEDVKNIKKESPLLYQAIEDFGISKSWLAEKVYESSWTDDKDNQQKLTVRLRNKLNGNGKVTLKEIKVIEDALIDFADNLKKKVEKSKAERSKRLSKTVSEILDYLEEEDRNNLLK